METKVLILCKITCLFLKVNYLHCFNTGHNQPFGSHQPAMGKLTELHDFPLPVDFYENFVIESQPFIIKGGAKKLPAFKLWNDEFLKSKYGYLNVTVEMGKKEDRSQNILTPTLSTFLDMYKNNDIYMVNDVHYDMMGK